MANNGEPTVDEYFAGVECFKNLVQMLARCTHGKGRWVFRGDMRTPDVIFAHGFRARGAGLELPLFEHAKEFRNDTPYVSTSQRSTLSLREFCEAGAWVYVIRRDVSGRAAGIDVNQTLGERSPFADEHEVAFKDYIPTMDILGARRVLLRGKFSGPFLSNSQFMAY